MLLTLRHLLGVRFCPRCPNCAASERPCSDAFGSNALATGGVLGRVDAVFGSIECQKSGALHAHMQVFVQCRHQRDSLAASLTWVSPRSKPCCKGMPPTLPTSGAPSRLGARSGCRGGGVAGVQGLRLDVEPAGLPGKPPAAARGVDAAILGGGRGAAAAAQAASCASPCRPRGRAAASGSLPRLQGPDEV